MFKSFLRQEMLAKREQLSDSEVKTRSHLLCQHLFPWIESQDVTRVLAYASFRREPDMSALMQISDKVQLGLPVSNRKDKTLQFRCWEREAELLPGAYGILEPPKSAAVLIPDAQTLVLVPAVAIARNGSRIGYGAGYYDRFLAEHRSCKTIGIVFDEFFVPSLPEGELDISVQYVCTERGVQKVRSL